jgi:hypothetical protein
MTLRALVWNATQRRPRAPFRLVGGLLVVVLVGLAGTLAAELVAGALWPDRPFAYVVVTSTLGLGLGATVGVVVAARLVDRRRLADYGLRGGRAWWRDVLAGVGLAVAVQAAVLGVLLAAGWATVVDVLVAGPEGFLLALGAALAAFLVVAVYEELVVRGFVLTNVAEGLAGYGRSPAVAVAVIASSLLFGVGHATNPNASLVSAAGIAVVGVAFGACYVLTGRLGLAVGLHLGWNVAMGVLFGLPVSGLDVTARVLAVEVTGPATWTGGAFGPEAGLLGVFAALAALAGVVAYARVVEGRLRVHPDLLSPDLRGTARRDVHVGAERPASDRDADPVTTTPRSGGGR